jgi:large subunit ribosomal protein L10
LLSRADKEAQVAELKDKFSRATCLYLVDYRGLDVESVNKLRRRVRKEGNGKHEYRVLKNSVLRRADRGLRLRADRGEVRRPDRGRAVVRRSAGLAKILDSFAEENQAFALKGAVVDGTLLERARSRSSRRCRASTSCAGRSWACCSRPRPRSRGSSASRAPASRAHSRRARNRIPDRFQHLPGSPGTVQKVKSKSWLI